MIQSRQIGDKMKKTSMSKAAAEHLKRRKLWMWGSGIRKRKLKQLPEEKRAEIYLDRGDNFRDLESGTLELGDFQL